MQMAIEADSAERSIRGPCPILPEGGLKLLLALVSTEGAERESLKRKLKVTDSEYDSALSALQREYLVDVVSGLDGNRIRETLRLTDYGQSVLTRIMESTFELPE